MRREREITFDSETKSIHSAPGEPDELPVQGSFIGWKEDPLMIMCIVQPETFEILKDSDTAPVSPVVVYHDGERRLGLVETYDRTLLNGLVPEEQRLLELWKETDEIEINMGTDAEYYSDCGECDEVHSIGKSATVTPDFRNFLDTVLDVLSQ